MGIKSKSTLISSHPKTTIKVGVKVSQHQQDIEINLPISLYKLIRKYSEISLVEVYFRSLLPQCEKSTISLQVDDDRLVSDRAKKQVSITFPVNEDLFFSIRGFPSVTTSSKSPWKVSIKSVISNVKFGTKIGELVLRPHFIYSNSFSRGHNFEVEKREGDQLTLRRDHTDQSGKGIIVDKK